MAQADLKTKKNDKDVDAFLDSVEDEQQQADSKVIRNMMKKASGESGSMWGPSIVGFGSYHYKGASGREGDWMRISFSPRKGKISVYIMDGFDNYQKLLSKLGKHSTAVSCLYIKRLSDVDQKVLQELITQSYKHGLPMGEVK